MAQSIRVALIDDDKAVLDALHLYLKLKKLDVSPFESGIEFLAELDKGLIVDCIVSDVRMPDFDGISLYRTLLSRKIKIPVILITGHGDIDLAVMAVKEGIHDFIQKPFNEERLLASIEDAVAHVSKQNLDAQNLANIASRVARLSERQREVMLLAVRGLTNKEIAKEMKIGTRTVESYRAWVMERVGARNLAELIRIGIRLGMSD